MPLYFQILLEGKNRRVLRNNGRQNEKMARDVVSILKWV